MLEHLNWLLINKPWLPFEVLFVAAMVGFSVLGIKFGIRTGIWVTTPLDFKKFILIERKIFYFSLICALIGLIGWSYF